MFRQDVENEISLEYACCDCNAVSLLKWGKELHKSENISHMILHLIPDETFKKIKDVQFASPYVQRKALKQSTSPPTMILLIF